MLEINKNSYNNIIVSADLKKIKLLNPGLVVVVRRRVAVNQARDVVLVSDQEQNHQREKDKEILTKETLVGNEDNQHYLH